MYANGEGLGTPVCKSSVPDEAWNNWNDLDKYISGKRIVSCICPKCRKRFNVYMMWTGRGMPRKYCADCKAAIDNYDESAIFECRHAAQIPAKKRGGSVTDD